MNENRHYMELLVKSNFNTNRMTYILKEQHSSLNYKECYNILKNYRDKYAKNEEKKLIEDAFHNWSLEKEKEKKLAKIIYSNLKRNVSINELSKEYRIQPTRTIELYYQHIWNTLKKKKNITDLTEKEELILKKYLLYSYINNYGDTTTFIYNDIYTNKELPEEEIHTFLKTMLNNYIESNAITKSEKKEVERLGYISKEQELVTLEELKEMLKKEEKKYIQNINEKVNEMYTNKGQPIYLTERMTVDFVKYNQKEEVEKLKQFLEKMKKEKKTSRLTATIKELGTVYEHIINAFDNINEKDLNKTYFELKIKEKPQLLLTLNEKDCEEVLRSLSAEDFKSIKPYMNEFKYEIVKLKRIYNKIYEERKKELDSITINEENNKKTKELDKTTLEIFNKIMNYITKNEESLTEEEKLFLQKEDFTLLDYYSLTKKRVEDVYNEIYTYAKKTNNIIPEKEIAILNKWISCKTGLSIAKNGGIIIKYRAQYVTDKEIENDTIIIKGREISVDERKQIVEFLKENKIELFHSVYKNALRRYVAGTLNERYNTFSKTKTKVKKIQ